ncbi:MAG: hypothetical protein RL740_227 [Actinomycetota bacterium]
MLLEVLVEQTLARDTQLAIKSLKTAHIICDLALNVITMNESASKFINPNFMNAKSRNLIDQIESSSHHEFVNALKTTAADGLSRNIIDNNLRKGEISDCQISRIGEVLLIQITEITETQRQLAREHIEFSRNSAILEAINHSVLVIDFIDQTVLLNSIYEQVFGDYSELRTLFFNPNFNLTNYNPTTDTYISESNSEMVISLQEVWKTGEPKIDLLSRATTNSKALLYRKIVRWDYSGSPRGMIVSGTDISELVNYREEVEVSQLQIRELLKNLNIWIVVLDEGSGVAELYFPDGSHLTQEKFIENLSSGKQQLIRDAIEELYKNGFATIVAPSEAGDRIIRTSISFASNGPAGTRKILAINSDVTEKLQYEELENSRTHIAQVQKFAQGIAHDFGNISQAIQGFTKLLDGEISTDSGAKILENLKISANRALRVSQKISEIARIQVLENSEIEILEFLNAKSEQFQNLVGPNVILDIKKGSDVNGLIFANIEQVERIIENILENAGHALNGNGKVSIDCSNDVTSDYLILRISNDGPAIPKQIADRIFMPFVTSRKEDGTGLGLYLAHEYLNTCGGRIELKNHNRDVSFTLFLPRKKGETK